LYLKYQGVCKNVVRVRVFINKNINISNTMSNGLCLYNMFLSMKLNIEIDFALYKKLLSIYV